MDAYLKDQFDFTGVKAALLVEQSILVILRDNKPAIPWPNMWELTGGGREGLETPLECLRREVWEELGLILEEKSIIWSKIYPSMLDKDRSAVFVVVQISQEQYQEIDFGDEGQEFKLMPIEDFIKAEGIIPLLQERFKDYLSEKEENNIFLYIGMILVILNAIFLDFNFFVNILGLALILFSSNIIKLIGNFLKDDH